MALAYARDYWKGAVMVSIQGYGDAQIVNAAVIADVARSMGLGDRGALLGVMCAMGESSLRNIDYGDWETNGVRNPDGTPTSSIGLFQQQAWWGSPAERMDARYAAWAFFNALVKVRDWATLRPTIAIHRVQINADPNHYAKYETPARAVLAYITDQRARGVRFMGAPAIEWIRDGVGFRPDAAAAFRRAEASWGSTIPCNSTYRDYGLQLSMWQAWTAWTEGRGPKPNHSRALHPDESMHCQGLALDTNLWTARGFIDHMADHGFIRTAAWDPTEQHHFEYQWWRDNHRNEQAPAATDARPKEWDEMASRDDVKQAAKEGMAEALKDSTDLLATVVKNELNQRMYGDLSLIPIAELNNAMFLRSASTRRRIRVQNTAHAEFIRRALEARGMPGQQMSSSEVDIVDAYCLAVYPPAGKTVDASALSAALKSVDAGDGSAVKAAVDASTS